MPLATNDLLQPKGEIDPDLFPANDLGGSTQVRVAAYLAEAQGKTSNETAQRYWVYYRAYDAVWQKFVTTPSSAKLDDVTHTITKAQIEQIKAQADYYRGLYDDITGAPPPTSEAQQTSFSIPNQPTW